MPRHVPDENLIGLVTGEPELSEGTIATPQHVPRAEAEHRQNVANLGLIERPLAVIAIAVFDPAGLEQGDRLATGASRAGADKIEGVGHAEGAPMLTTLAMREQPEMLESHIQDLVARMQVAEQP